jgi:glutaredoxin 3
VKEFLSQKGVQYTERDVAVDREAAREMIQKTGQRGVPVVTVGDQVVIGFDRARLEQVLGSQGPSRHPSLGIQVADASKIAQKVGAIPLFGALVGGVRPGSAGEKAGLLRGDIITEVNLRRINNADDLEKAISTLSQGSRVTLAYMRGDKELRVEINL